MRPGNAIDGTAVVHCADFNVKVAHLQPLIFHYLCRFHNRTRGTLVPSVGLRDHLQAVGVQNVSILGRGVDSQLFTPERRCAALRRTWGVAENDLAVLYVGRVAPEKNVGLAVAAYRSDGVKGAEITRPQWALEPGRGWL